MDIPSPIHGVNLSKLTEDEATSLIAVFLLTEGNLYHNTKFKRYDLWLYNVDHEMHDLFIDLIKHATAEKHYVTQGLSKIGVPRTLISFPKDASFIAKLFERSPSYKKHPVPTVKDYLEQTQPSLNFLMNEGDEAQVLAIRIAMSANGSISLKISNSGKNFHIRSGLTLSCQHPILSSQWLTIFHQKGLNLRIHKESRAWSRIRGLESWKKRDVECFSEIGGFLLFSTITRNSKNFYGIRKNQLLNIAKKLHGTITNDKEKLKDMIRHELNTCRGRNPAVTP